MSIKEIIDAERWKTHLYDSDDWSSTNECHNAALDRILIGMEKRIAELEAQLEAYRHANGSKADRIQKMKEQYEEDARSWKQHIAELEAQVPKVAKPTIICDGIWSFACGECQKPVNRDECYCAKCGAKLEWT